MIPRPRRHAAAQCITLRSRLSQPFIQFEHALLEGRRRVSPSTGRQGRSLGHFVDVPEGMILICTRKKVWLRNPYRLTIISKIAPFLESVREGL